MSDIYNRKLAEHGGSFSVDDTMLTFPNIPGQAAFVPFIVTQVGLNYAQQVSRIYGMNMNKVFLVSGRAQGSGSMQQILAPQADLADFYQTYGNVCNADKNVLQFALRSGCGAGAVNANVQRFLASLCIVSQLGISSQAEQGYVSNTAQFSYEGLEYSTAAA